MVAPGYEAHAGNVPAVDTPLYRAWVDQIARLMPPAPAHAVDLATGTGFVALILAALGHRVTAVDLSDDMLDEACATAASRGLTVDVRSDDAVAPTLDAAAFDIVTC